MLASSGGEWEAPGVGGWYYYGEMDPSPTKAWMIHHREDLDVEPLYQLAFGKRPREELYDLRHDPDYMYNRAADEAYERVRLGLEARLLAVLREQADPRLVGPQPCQYEAEAWYEGGMGWLEPENVPTTISYEAARVWMEVEMRRAMVPRHKL